MATTLQHLLLERASASPGAPLLIDAATGEEKTYAQATEAARRWAAFFAAQGLAPGGRVAVILTNSLDYAEILLGAALAGVTLCPYNPALTAPELSALARRFGARIALVAPARREELAAELSVPTFTVGAKGELPAALPAPAETLPPVAPETLMVLIMTSGTTGGVKACRLNHGNLTWTSAKAAEAWGRDAGSRYLTPLPLFHINAQIVGLWASVQGGGAVAIGSRLPAAKLWEAAARCRATGMSSVPAIVYDLLNGEGAPPPGLKYVVTSSAPLPPQARAAFEERFGVPLLVCYGLSEAGCFVSYSRLSPASPPGAIGMPIGCEVAIAGDEVIVRGPGLMEGYDGDPAATAAALRDGWLHTGDCGSLDPAGFLYLHGRLKDMINRGGEKIAPDAIEAVLRECPGLLEVAVFGVSDERLGEEVAAAVIPAPGTDWSDEDFWEFCDGKLAEFETPKYWQRLQAFPRGATGKVLRRSLKEGFSS